MCTCKQKGRERNDPQPDDILGWILLAEWLQHVFIIISLQYLLYILDHFLKIMRSCVYLEKFIMHRIKVVSQCNIKITWSTDFFCCLLPSLFRRHGHDRQSVCRSTAKVIGRNCCNSLNDLWSRDRLHRNQATLNVKCLFLSYSSLSFFLLAWALVAFILHTHTLLAKF